MIEHETRKLVLNEPLSHSPYVGEFESIGFRLRRVVKHSSSAKSLKKRSGEGIKGTVKKRRTRVKTLKTCNAPIPERV